MIVLDTNVISELVRAEPEALVVGWVDGLVVADTFITAVTAAELLHGVALLPGGRRRTRLADLIHTVIEEDFAARVLAFDVVASGHYADIAAHRSGLGRPISQADAQTAAICRSHGASVATRNITDFDETGLTVIDPWTDPS